MAKRKKISIERCRHFIVTSSALVSTKPLPRPTPPSMQQRYRRIPPAAAVKISKSLPGRSFILSHNAALRLGSVHAYFVFTDATTTRCRSPPTPSNIVELLRCKSFCSHAFKSYLIPAFLLSFPSTNLGLRFVFVAFGVNKVKALFRVTLYKIISTPGNTLQPFSVFLIKFLPL